MINEQLFRDILDQLDKNQEISEVTLWLIILGVLVYFIEKYFGYRINKQNTKNEKKGDEELYISKKQYDMETSVFIEFLEGRYELQNILMEIMQNEGELSRSEKEKYDLTFKKLKERHKKLVDYLNKYICFVPFDIWDKIEKYTKSVMTIIDEWEEIFNSGLKCVLVTETIKIKMKEVKENSDEATNIIRNYVYKKKVILG